VVICAICGELVGQVTPENLFATWGVFFPPGHALYPYCDAPIHWECYAIWPERREFARRYVQMWVESDTINPFWSSVHLSDNVYVSVNPSAPVEAVSVRLFETGSSSRVPLAKWEPWLADEEEATKGLHPLEQQALHAALHELRRDLPTREAVVNAVDWSAKHELRERQRESARQREAERLTKTRQHNKACRAYWREGVTCPHCGAVDIRFVDRAPEGKSLFICNQCARSFGPVDLHIQNLQRFGP